MPTLPVIDDSNTFVDKVNDRVLSVADYLQIRAQDLNALKDRIAENRTEINGIPFAPWRMNDGTGGFSDTLAETDSEGLVLILGGTFTMTLDDDLPDGFQCEVMTYFATISSINPTNGGSILGATSAIDGMLLRIIKTGAPGSGSSWLCLPVYDVDLADHPADAGNPHAVTAAQAGAVPEDVPVSTYSSATLTLNSTHRNTHYRMNTAPATIAVTIPDTLPVGMSMTMSKVDAANSLTFAGSGTMTIDYYGQSTCTAVDSFVAIFIESATKARITITEKV